MSTSAPELIGAPPRARPRRAPRALLVAGTIVALATALPAIYLIIRAADGGWSGIVDIVVDARTRDLLVRTVGLTAAVTAAAIVVAVPLALLTTRTDLPFRRVITVLAAAPLVIPSYVGAYVIIGAFGPRGILQGWLEPFGVERLPSIAGFLGAFLTLTLFTYPYVYLTVRAAIRRLDPSLEEAARTLGYRGRSIVLRVIVPQLRPAIGASGLLVALYTIHDFGAVSLLRFDTFTRAIFVAYQGSIDRTRAAVLALVLIALTLVVVALEIRSRGRAAYARVHGSAARRPSLARLGRARWPVFAVVMAFLSLALFVPVGVIVHWLARSVRAGTSVGDVLGPAANTLFLGALAAGIALIAAWPVSFLSVRHPGRASRTLERASFVGYALPGVVVALSLVFFGARLAPAIYQTVPLLLFAYLVLFLPQATGAVRSSIHQVPAAVEEAARTLGASRLRTVRAVIIPLIRPGLLAGFALVMLTVMKELPATLLLAPTGYDTLATDVWSATSVAAFDRAALPALTLILLAVVPLVPLLMREDEPT